MREARNCKKDRESEGDAEDITATTAAAIAFTGEQSPPTPASEFDTEH